MVDDSAPATEGPSPAAQAIQNALPGIFGRANVVISPYPFATQDDDKLRVTVINALPGVTVNVHGRLVTRKGEAKPFRFPMTPTSDRVASSQDFALAGGFVSNLSAFASGATPFVGQTFVIVQIIRGASTAAFVLGTLLASCVTSTQPIGWPGTPIETSIENGGYIRTITGTKPAAGAEILDTCPAGARWEVIAFRAQLVCAAAGGTRQPSLLIDNGGPAIGIFGNPATVAPSGSATFFWAPGISLTSVVAPGANVGGLGSEPTLLAGWDLNTLTSGINAGDQWQAPIYVVRERLEAQ